MAEGVRFGTSGVRGLVSELTDAVCAAYARAFLGVVGGMHLLVGRDLRDSSSRLAAACAAAGVEQGVVVTDCGELPTPALALEAMRLGVPAIMVTGSHIPADRNGLKFYRPTGEINKADEAAIVAALAPAAAAPPIVPAASSEARERYVDRYTGLQVSLRGLRIGVYQHSTVARDMLIRILDALGADVVPLGRADTFIPVDTEALRPEDVALARGWSAEHALDAIVSADGDADRPLIADEHGTFLRGDVVGLLTAKFLGAATVVTPVTSSSAAELCGAFRTVRRTRVGSPHVIAGMADAVPPVVGYEANGGVLLGSSVMGLLPLPTRDAVLPILAVLGLARREGLSVSQLVATLPPRRTASALLRHMPPEITGPFIARLADHAFAADLVRHPVVTVDMTDGAKLALADGDSVHFRASGNAPELRCYAESSTEARAEELVGSALKHAREALG